MMEKVGMMGGDGECYGEFEQDWKESKTFKNLTGK